MNIRLIIFASVTAVVLPTLLCAEAAIPAGKKIYEAKCASCHGADGKGKPVMAKAFKIDPALLDVTGAATVEKKDEELLKIISAGKNKMPAYAKQIKPDDQIAVIQYMRSLAPKKESNTQGSRGAAK